jgi:hypothetical protein
VTINVTAPGATAGHLRFHPADQLCRDERLNFSLDDAREQRGPGPRFGGRLQDLLRMASAGPTVVITGYFE